MQIVTCKKQLQPCLRYISLYFRIHSCEIAHIPLHTSQYD